MYELGRDEVWIPMAYDAIQRQRDDGRLAMAGGNIEITDPASAGEVCLRAYQKTGDVLFLNGAERMLDYLRTAPRTPKGTLCHMLPSEGSRSRQVWVDSMYMAPPFLAVMGEYQEAVHQLQGMADELTDPETGLLFHMYDAGKERFLRRQLWSTGNGWALMGMARVHDEIASSDPVEAAGLEQKIRKMLPAMLRFQCDDGRFHDVMDDPTTFMDGTAGLMMAVCVYRGVLGGWLDESLLFAADAAFEGASAHIDSMGILHEVCGCPSFDHQGTSA